MNDSKSEHPGFMGWWHRLDIALHARGAMIANYREAGSVFSRDDGTVEIGESGLRQPTAEFAAECIIKARSANKNARDASKAGFVDTE